MFHLVWLDTKLFTVVSRSWTFNQFYTKQYKELRVKFI